MAGKPEKNKEAIEAIQRWERDSVSCGIVPQPEPMPYKCRWWVSFSTKEEAEKILEEA